MGLVEMANLLNFCLCFSTIPRPRRRRSWSVWSVARCSLASSVWVSTEKPPTPPRLTRWAASTTSSTAPSANTTTTPSTTGTTGITTSTPTSRCPRLKKIILQSSLLRNRTVHHWRRQCSKIPLHQSRSKVFWWHSSRSTSNGRLCWLICFRWGPGNFE